MDIGLWEPRALLCHCTWHTSRLTTPSLLHWVPGAPWRSSGRAQHCTTQVGAPTSGLAGGGAPGGAGGPGGGRPFGEQGGQLRHTLRTRNPTLGRAPVSPGGKSRSHSPLFPRGGSNHVGCITRQHEQHFIMSPNLTDQFEPQLGVPEGWPPRACSEGVLQIRGVLLKVLSQRERTLKQPLSPFPRTGHGAADTQKHHPAHRPNCKLFPLPGRKQSLQRSKTGPRTGLSQAGP